MPDHDQRFKTLLQMFPDDFFRLFFPDWAAQFDFERIEWLPTEIFPNPPEGERRAIDLLAKLPFRSRIHSTGGLPGAKEMLALIHLEVESRDSVAAFRRRMMWYYVILRQKYDLPVLPVALLLNVGLDGIGRDEYSEDFGTAPVLRFWYHYAGLPHLDGELYLPEDNRIAPALLGFMKLPTDKRPHLKARAADNIRRQPTNSIQKFLVLDCLETHLELTTSEKTEYDRLLQTDAYRETQVMVQSTFERVRDEALRKGRQEGLEEGKERASRDLIVALIADRFGPVSAELREKVARWPADELVDLLCRVARVDTLEQAGL